MNLEQQDVERVAELPYRWEIIKNKTVLISGGTGFVGSFLIDVIKYRNIKYDMNTRIISISRRGGNLDEAVEFIKEDVTNPIFYEGKVDFIIHLASNTHPRQYGEDPVGTITTNVIGCNNLLKLAVEKKAEFLLASSVEIYGQGLETPMNEEFCGYINCNAARAGYNEAKRTCESLSQSYKQQYGTEVKIIRFARIIGADRKLDTKAITQFMDRAINGEDVILKSKGNQMYSFCYVADAVSGLLKVLFDGKNGEAYNISGENEGISLGGYAELIAKLANRNVIYQLEDDVATSRASYALMDNTKIKGIGWKPLYTVSDALLRTYEIRKSWCN